MEAHGPTTMITIVAGELLTKGLLMFSWQGTWLHRSIAKTPASWMQSPAAWCVMGLTFATVFTIWKHCFLLGMAAHVGQQQQQQQQQQSQPGLLPCKRKQIGCSFAPWTTHTLAHGKAHAQKSGQDLHHQSWRCACQTNLSKLTLIRCNHPLHQCVTQQQRLSTQWFGKKMFLTGNSHAWANATKMMHDHNHCWFLAKETD